MTPNQKGFTLLEILVVAVLIGIVAAIMAPGWTRFVEGNRLGNARDELYSGLRKAQIQSQSQSTDWQFSMKEDDGTVQWAVHPTSLLPSHANWKAVESGSSVNIDFETTLAISNGVYLVRFDNKGNVQYRLGRITLSSERAPGVKRCVVVSTIIGAMRKAKEQLAPRDGKMCY